MQLPSAARSSALGDGAVADPPSRSGRSAVMHQGPSTVDAARPGPSVVTAREVPTPKPGRCSTACSKRLIAAAISSMYLILHRHRSVDRPTASRYTIVAVNLFPGELTDRRRREARLSSVDRPRRRRIRSGRTPRRAVEATTTESETATAILEAARIRLLADGYAGLSTRKVAQEAGVPLSQVHYHFGSKGAMVLALLERREPPAAGAPDRDVRRGRAAVAPLRAGVRLPRGRSRERVRPGAAGDDRRRVVQSRDRRRGPRACSSAGTSC